MRAFGLDVGSYRLSLYGLVSAIIVAVLLWVAVTGALLPVSGRV